MDEADSQPGLDDFGAGGGPAETPAERPAEEAAAVAGNGAGSNRGIETVDTDLAGFDAVEGTVSFAVTQVNYTVEGYGEDEEPVIQVFGRTPGGELVHARVYEFRPYFYAPLPSVSPEELRRYDAITGWEETDDAGEPYESIRGTRLLKIFGRTPRDVGQIRDEFDHYEADILFPNRFLIDKDVTEGLRVPAREAEDGALRVHEAEVESVDVQATPRVSTFDIEVDDRSGFPEDGEERIICLTSHDSYRDEYVVWLFDPPDGVEGPQALAAYEPIEDDFEADVRVFQEEEAMLEAFANYVIEETDPDIFTGWNCLPGDSQVLLANGQERSIRDIDIGDEVVGSAEEGTVPATVTNKWESEKQVLEFDLADGSTLETSPDHRVMVGDDNDVGWKRGSQIEAGDFVLKPRTLNVSGPSVPLLADLVPRERQRYNREAVEAFKDDLPYGAVTELSDRFEASKDVLWKNEPSVWSLGRCEVAADEYEISLPDGGQVHKRTATPLDRKVTEHELYLAGLVVTDGSMSKSDGIRFYNTRKELHEQFPGPNHLEPDGKGCFKQNVLDFTRMYAFHDLGIPYGSKNESAIDLRRVFEMPEGFIGRFLAGVIDGDGCVSSNITVAAENDSLGRWYSKLFRRLGIYAEQRGNTIRIAGDHRSIDLLKEKVLPHMNHSEKVSRLEQYDGGKSGRSENIPYSLFDTEAGTDERRIGRDKHRRGINLKRHETSSNDWNQFVFVQVDTVQGMGTQTTFDIQTTTRNFIAEDCLVHNCDDFDAPYLLDRMEELQSASHDYDLDIDRLSRVDEVWRSDWQGPDIKGRVVFDLLRAYRATKFTELESYRLDAVGEQELGVGKERYPGDIGDLWESDPERLLEYNLRDVELCVELDRKQDIIAFFEEVASFVGCKLEDAPTAGDAVDMYVLHKAHGDFALPSKGSVESGEEFEGGAVFEPITGVRENVSVLDLKSLYPMCMWTVNASPETKVDPETYDGDTYRTPTGQHFRKEPAGMMREMIDELLTEREEKKAFRDDHEPGSPEYERYDRQQSSVKVIMNSLYGVSGWDRFRLYDKDNAAAVTATGREVISYTEESVSEFGYDVIYGDTDSVMLEIGQSVNKSTAIEDSFALEERINDSYDAFADERLNAQEHRFEIEFEKLYRRFFQAGKKKRYAGHIVWKEGKDVDDIDITGFEYQRSDIAPITKEVQQQVIEMIVTGEDLDDVKAYVHDVIEDFQAGNVSLDEVAIPGGIGKRLGNYDTDTAHVRGAKYANVLLGTNFQRGSKPKRVYLDRVHANFFQRFDDSDLTDWEREIYNEFKREVSADGGVICFEYADQVPAEFEVDWEKMLDKTLKGPIARILEALDISWEEVKAGQEQTGLESFM